ncbi:MAG: UDP-N-acetylmuramate--L-alanine ligase [Candidatus Marinamargulisbacteria bacterium]
MTKKKTYFFIGINGIGMSGLAILLAEQGHTILGSDTSSTLRRDEFNQRGIKVVDFHCKSHISDADWTIVYSSAISADNPERQQAKALGCQQVKRGALLAMVMCEFKHQLGVVGTHGKTTTTSLLIHIFSEFLSPSYFVGGHLDGAPHAQLNASDWFISELDESDGSFLSAVPNHAIITNIEHEHINYYLTKADMVMAFQAFIQAIIDSGGVCAINIDDSVSKKLIHPWRTRASLITYGIESEKAQVRADSIQYTWQGISFRLIINGAFTDTVTVPLMGRHNVYNTLSAIAILIQANIPLKHVLNGLASFRGVRRRLELKYQANGISLYDDYAHHPTEVISTLEGIYKSFSNHRIITIFQPHRYSRLTNLFEAFATSFERSSKTCIMPVFSTGESPDNYKSSMDLTERINDHGGCAVCFNTVNEVIDDLSGQLRNNDIILIMGAGDITNIAKDLVPLIKNTRSSY